MIKAPRDRPPSSIQHGRVSRPGGIQQDTIRKPESLMPSTYSNATTRQWCSSRRSPPNPSPTGDLSWQKETRLSCNSRDSASSYSTSFTSRSRKEHTPLQSCLKRRRGTPSSSRFQTRSLTTISWSRCSSYQRCSTRMRIMLERGGVYHHK